MMERYKENLFVLNRLHEIFGINKKLEERWKNMKESAVQQTLIARTKYVKKAQGEQF